MSRITTHILDTSKGAPAAGVRVVLYRKTGAEDGTKRDAPVEITGGLTNKDGRIGDWLAADAVVENGIYTLRFETKPYFDQQLVATFYPFVEIHFEITGEGHYHIPLLISPYGYSTYRGS